MLGNKTSDEWIAQYATSHQHPVNRACHTVGIPLIVLSIALGVAGFWRTALGLFVLGWVFQFVGHAFEGKPPGVLPRLAVSRGRPQVVGGEDARTCLTRKVRTSSIEVARERPRAASA